jgi:hypothetical protein
LKKEEEEEKEEKETGCKRQLKRITGTITEPNIAI